MTTPDDAILPFQLNRARMRGRVVRPPDTHENLPWPLVFPGVIRNRVRVTMPWRTHIDPEQTKAFVSSHIVGTVRTKSQPHQNRSASAGVQFSHLYRVS